MPKIQARAELKWIAQKGQQYSIPLDKLHLLYCDMLDHIFPTIEKSSDEERQDAAHRVMEWIEALQENAIATFEEANARGGLKDTRSDKLWMRRLMKSMDQLTYQGPSGEFFVKHAIAGPKTNGTTEPPAEEHKQD